VQEERAMDPIRLFSVVSLVALPTVMFGGYSLLRLLVQGGVLSPFQEQFFRAGHAHAGVLLVLSLVYYRYLAGTALSDGARWLAGGALLAGILAQSGGFFLHLLVGAPGQPSAGTALTTAGAALLAGAVLWLAYAVATAPPAPRA
jgi:hypothetical protein